MYADRFQVSKLLWKRLLRKNNEQLKQSKVYMYERTSFGKSNGKYMPYPKVDSFLKVLVISFPFDAGLITLGTHNWRSAQRFHRTV
jgi:hypothetical protein